MQSNLFILILLLSSQLVYAQQMGPQTIEQLQESPAGSNILKYIDLYNSEASLSSENLKTVFAEEVFEKIPIDDLIQILEEGRMQDGQIALYEALRLEKFHYELLFKSIGNQDWMKGSFMLEKQAPYKIVGFGFDNGKPSNNESPIYGPKEQVAREAKPIKIISKKEIKQVADEICQAYHQMNWFDGVILIAKEGKPIFEKAYGLADREQQIPNTIDTKFRIGSLNKSYTDVLILQLIEQGKIKLDQKLADFNLGFPADIAQKITIQHLLTHTSGFGDIFIPEYLDNIRAYKDIDDILPLLLNAPLIFEPGTDQSYSNYGYIVLGAILEKVTGSSFEQLLQSNILDKIKAIATHYDIAENISGEAQSYQFNLDGTKTNNTATLEYPTPDGGMYANASDLLAFYQAQTFSNQLLSDETKLKMVADYRDIDMKWEDILNNPRAIQGFAGGGPGVSALVLTFLKEKYIVIILANTDEMVTEEIGFRLEAAMMGRSYDTPKLPAQHLLFQLIEEKGEDYLIHNFEKVVKEEELGKPDAMLLNNVGYDLIYSGNPDAAIQLFKMNIKLFPDDANPYDSLAEAYYNTGDLENAIKYYKMALEIDPDFEPSLKMLKQIEQEKN